MDRAEIRKAAKGLIESVMQSPAIKRRHTNYSLVVRTLYEDIQTLRNSGYSFNVICEALIEKGILDDNAKSERLASLFSREKNRRAKLCGQASQIRDRNGLD